MRTTLKTIALATFALSIATGGAFAAGMGTPNSGLDRPDSGHNTTRTDAAAMQDTTPVMHRTAMPATAHRPRLNTILAELHSAGRKIDREHAAKTLSVSERNALKGEAGRIRSMAMNVADAHHGAIPRPAYQRLQGDIRKLDRDIVRLG
jgi:hypothetical protein